MPPLSFLDQIHNELNDIAEEIYTKKDAETSFKQLVQWQLDTETEKIKCTIVVNFDKAAIP